MIHVESLTRKYGDFTAVNKVSFDIEQGEIVGLLGHNGAGKTTIMKMMTGFLEPTAGDIWIDGLDIRQSLQNIQQKIGYLPENCPLYPEMTVMDYLDYAASLHGITASEKGKHIRDALMKTELTDRACQNIGTLSRGLCQRVGVAQAILHHPRFLILDEPTNGLDPTQIQHMRVLIRNLAKHATIVLSTHILREVQAVCDRVIVIRNGEKALDSRIDELQAGNRLLISVDADNAAIRKLLANIMEIDKIELVQQDGESFEYALTLNTQEHASAASRIARAILDAGCDLYSLHRENRDLETIFGEISAH